MLDLNLTTNNCSTYVFQKILQKYSLEWEAIKIKLNTCDNLSQAVGISDCPEVVNDVYDGSQNLQQSEAVNNKESKTSLQNEFSGFIGDHMYVTDTGATFIGKIKENIQVNHGNGEKNRIIEKVGNFVYFNNFFKTFHPSSFCFTISLWI